MTMKMLPSSCSRTSVLSWRRRLLASVLSPLLAIGSLLAPVHAQTSAVPGFLSYQGKVTNANGTLVGAGAPVNRLVIFRIWSHSGNSTINDLVYSEQQTITVSEGEFSALIGQGNPVSGTPLGYSETAKGPNGATFNVGSPVVFGGATRFLGVTIDDGTTASDPEISPRQQLVTSAYAMRAKYAESIGSNGNSTITVTDSGNVGFGNAAPALPLSFASQLGDKISLYGNFNFGLGIQANNVQLKGHSSADDITFGYGPSASMTETMRIKGNGNVGIGTNNPQAKLDVNGAINVFDGGSKAFSGGIVSEAGAAMVNFGMNDTRFGSSQNNASQGGFLRLNTQSGSNLFQFFARPAAGTSIVEALSITGSGNVGVGTASPTQKLHVGGSILTSSGTTGINYLLDTNHYIKATSNVGVAIGTYQAADGLFLQQGTGNVGIATTSPAAKLHVVGSGWFGNDTGGLGTSAGKGVRVFFDGTFGSIFSYDYGASATANLILQSPGGNVGIGTTSPSAKLHVAGGIKIDSSNILEFGVGTTKNGDAGKITYGGFDSGATLNIVGAGTGSSDRSVRIWDRLGIGTSSPIAPLHVASSNNVTAYQRLGYMYQHGASADDTANVTGPYGLVVDSYIRTPEVDISSDARIKSVIGRSSGANDLDVLQKIEVTDYQFRDQVGRGSRVMKKVIAQQVEQIYPTAVRQTRDIVPDIMAKAGVNDGWVQLATPLKAGERVRLLIGNNWEMTEVLEAELGRFRVNLPSSTNEVYVYGREVSDFRVIDYDAIAMLNVSATQELKRQHDTEVASLRTANEALIARVAELEAKDRARDAKLAAIEKLLSASSTVMAQPAKSATANGQE